MDDEISQTPFSGPETDERFPSGHWIGWYRQYGTRSRMLIRIWFQHGKVHATGSDGIGPFTFSGRYDTESGDVSFVKTYIARPELVEIFYQGRGEQKGVRGAWEFLGIRGGGEFHIWPESQSEGETDAVHVEQEIEIRRSVPTIANAPV